ncbi:MAG: YceI family protein [Chitinophagaceae bacterium]
MFKGLFFAMVLLTGHNAPTYIPTDNSSSIRFKIKNLGVSVNGSLKGIKGNIQFDPNNLLACRIEVTLDAQTINTGNGLRDDHLRKEEYFDVKNHPSMQFVSTKVTASTKPGTLFLFGNLTIKGVTKPISFPFTAIPQGNGYLFNGEFIINRRDFTIGGKSFTLAYKLTVLLNVFALKE